MNHETGDFNIELICVIVNFGMGSKIIKSAKHHGVSGGTITLGRGTVNSRILDFIGLSDIRKEVVYLAAEQETAYQALEEMNTEFEFHKPNHGIAFTTSICGFVGTHKFGYQIKTEERGAENIMYHIITVIVDKGKAEEVITAATQAGSKGGTIINARGSGIHETSKLFNMEIEPEKEMVLIVSESDMTEAIVAGVRESLKIDDPGNGIIFVQNANKTYGIRK
jgi:nitrogen regulatory protein PII